MNSPIPNRQVMTSTPDSSSSNQAAGAVEVVLNGRRAVAPQGSLIGLLREADVRLEVIAVEVNGEVVPREQLEVLRLQTGDTVEVVTLVGGG
ncbi:MAG: hypothetical protein KatS3mg111_3358 [Pirellulaceae bacterium]|nr:MAG: hypothetical protein KatS3mg111_3358 [Pirellulaceae bacterium]